MMIDLERNRLSALSPSVIVITVLASLAAQGCESRNFTIDYARNTFLKDGLPYRYISGSIHYFRVPSIYWRDRLLKAKAAGLNAVETVIPWNWHEPNEKEYRFGGDYNVTGFILTAQEVGLDVILRPGPYVCAEWEQGGFPWWLLKTPDIRYRTYDTRYLAAVKVWFSVLFPKLIPLLYKNGGPVISLQVENEYGSFYACDQKYMEWLRDTMAYYFGNDTVLFTVDGAAASYLRCGTIPGVYATVDFGPEENQTKVANNFLAQRQYSPQGPLVNTEFYTTWIDMFGGDWVYGDTDNVVTSIGTIYRLNASLNFYMFEGGTNFGYMASGMLPRISGLPYFSSVTTSYDYDAPLSEAGDPRYPLYHSIRVAVEVLTGERLGPIPPAIPKIAYGSLELQFVGTVFDLLDVVSPAATTIKSAYPLNMIQLNFPFGFVLYETVLPIKGGNISAAVGDRGYVFVDRQFLGILKRLDDQGNPVIAITCQPGQVLRILVENMGRQNYWRGTPDNDFKGIVSNVTLDNLVLADWKMYPIDVEKIFDFEPKFSANAATAKQKTKLPCPPGYSASDPQPSFIPSFYFGSFPALEKADTFWDSSGWGKGQLFINRNNVGRYWPNAGPQLSLYVPKSMLTEKNIVVAFELEKAGNCEGGCWLGTCKSNFTDIPVPPRKVGTKIAFSRWLQ